MVSRRERVDKIHMILCKSPVFQYSKLLSRSAEPVNPINYLIARKLIDRFFHCDSLVRHIHLLKVLVAALGIG